MNLISHDKPKQQSHSYGNCCIKVMCASFLDRLCFWFHFFINVYQCLCYNWPARDLLYTHLFEQVPTTLLDVGI